jgi:hypothetical protein
VNVRCNRYHRLASSLNFFRGSSLPGPEEASLFHNITVSGFLTVGPSVNASPPLAPPRDFVERRWECPTWEKPTVKKPLTVGWRRVSAVHTLRLSI